MPSVKLLLLATISMSLASLTSQATIKEEIKAVENGLRSQVHFSHEPLWNIEERMAHYQVPGVSIAVIKDYKVHWIKSYGLADQKLKTPVTTDTLFQAGSISKPVTAYAALKLVEQKILSLDSPVNQQLDGWKIPENELTKIKPVSLKNLLSHSAGLSVGGFIGYQKGSTIPTINQILDGQSPANSEAVRVVIQPETQFKYSGGGYTILQKLMTDVTKKSFPDIMEKLIFGPLGMTRSSFLQTHSMERDKVSATGYWSKNQAVVGSNNLYPEMAAGGLWSTAEDLAKFAIDVQLAIKSDSSQVLSQSMANEMLTPFVREFIGLGFRLISKEEQSYFFHSGRVPGFASNLIAHKEKGFGLVIMINSEKITPFMQELTNSVASYYQWDKFISPSFTNLPISKQELQRITGRYHFQPDVSFKVYAENGRLFKQEPLEQKQEMFRVGENEYITKTDDTIVSFQKNTNTGNIEYAVTMPNGKLFGRPRLLENESMPLDLVILGRVVEAEKAYVKFFEERPKFKAYSEKSLLETISKLNTKENDNATLPLLKMSTRLYSSGNDSWDALANYFLLNDDKENAILTYKNGLNFQQSNEQFKQKLNLLATRST